jgi:hypothetical protein
MDAPVRYAKNGDVNIAYRVFGGGSRDVVLVPGTLSHVEVLWELPVARHLLHRLTASRESSSLTSAARVYRIELQRRSTPSKSESLTCGR